MNTTTAASATFAVAPVEAASTALPEVEFEKIIDDCLASSVGQDLVVLPRRGWRERKAHAVTEPEQDVYPVNALLGAAYIAFTQHRPLVFSPDIVWLAIAQGVALHINEHAQSLRQFFVAHKGQEVLRVEGEGDWDSNIAAFGAQLQKHLRPEAHDLFVADFSTTGPVERLACQIAMMDGMQSYFGYELSECGVPYITVEGTAADWKEIVRRVEWLNRLGLEWWTRRLLPVLQRFVRACEGDIDEEFWLNIYQQTIPGSKGAYHGPLETFSGWIGVFFPFTREGRRNPLVVNPCESVATADFRPSLCRAPVTWLTRNGRKQLEFMAGLVAIDQHPFTLALRPRIGWIIREGGRPRFN